MSTNSRKLAVLKKINEWLKKGFAAGPFKEPPWNNFRVNSMIPVVIGE
jgi:hypothetical protein